MAVNNSRVDSGEMTSHHPGRTLPQPAKRTCRGFTKVPRQKMAGRSQGTWTTSREYVRDDLPMHIRQSEIPPRVEVGQFRDRGRKSVRLSLEYRGHPRVFRRHENQARPSPVTHSRLDPAPGPSRSRMPVDDDRGPRLHPSDGFVSTIGVRPTSPPHTTSVSSSIPRNF